MTAAFFSFDNSTAFYFVYRDNGWNYYHDAKINDLERLKAELAEDVKADKLRSLPLYSCKITGWASYYRTTRETFNVQQRVKYLGSFGSLLNSSLFLGCFQKQF